ncbi:hypothetical protein KTO58_01150 [Chitinophaga pendula]|uniref:hypothetical protein n=1 Tax=Chitinophaga TaxID=79328 RepID=UPI0012FE7102|nr:MULTISPECIES: hypothetical protein [Chitinophaga]UCJ07812.1 hypothetical protein KTO58_01150 [Chitinophaga pendula]
MKILPTKGNIATIAQNIAQDVIDGFSDPFDTIVRVEAIKKVCEEVRENLEKHVRDELDKYQGKPVGKLDAKIEAAETGVKYDFTGDPIWRSITAEIEPLVEKRKARESLLKTLTKTMVETDPETGETFDVPPPVKTSKSTFKISLGK